MTYTLTMPSDKRKNSFSKQEITYRKKLGIPEDAPRVLVFSESSHWDPDWLFTSEQYYRRYVHHNLDMALQELQNEPRRVYSIECIFFLKLYWERNKDKKGLIRDLVNEGRLRLTSSGMTTADTLVPSSEAILRDFLIGQEWLQKNGMDQEPSLAYFPDSFGTSHALPALLNAAGFAQTAITRVDGMFFMGCEFALTSKGYPLPGSTAERLQCKEKSMDFVWRTHDGTEVLTHWNAFTYGMGDLLAYSGLSRVYLFPVAVSNRSDKHVAKRVDQFVNQLAPLSRTPYLFCPIGTDFIPPTHGLVGLLDRYNQNHYPDSGVWVVNAGLDDYLNLLNFHRKDLPVIEVDPNPYWTGFYTSRPALKRSAITLVKKLLLAETQSLEDPDQRGARRDQAKLLEIWDEMIVSNHHDFITGTSPDKVVEQEQKPLLLAAHQKADVILRHQPLEKKTTLKSKSGSPHWKREGEKITISYERQIYETDKAFPGTIYRIPGKKNGDHTKEPLVELVDYHEGGGLWRMGNEFPGLGLRETRLKNESTEEWSIQETPTQMKIHIPYVYGKTSIRLNYIFSNNPLDFQISMEGKAAPGHTLCFRIHTGIKSKSVVMDEPGGVIERPWHKIYTPTFWPYQSFAFIPSGVNHQGFQLSSDMPGAISWDGKGNIQVVAIRNATHEKGYGFIIIPGLPIGGHEFSPHQVTLRLEMDGKEKQWQEMTESQVFPVGCDNSNVRITAVKPAWRGKGWIVRLEAFQPPAKSIQLSRKQGKIKKAVLCDARERDILDLKVQNGKVIFKMPRTIATVRILA
jgi:hypothetical protein